MRILPDEFAFRHGQARGTLRGMRPVALLSLLLAGCSEPGTPSTGRTESALPSAGQMSTVRTQFAWTFLGDGRLLVSGGFGATSAIATHDVWTPGTKTWTKVADSFEPHNLHSVTWAPKLSRVVLIGSPQNELYDPSSNTWEKEETKTNHWYHTATVLPALGGKILIAGGNDGSPTIFPDSELYDPAAAPGARFAPAGAMVTKRILHATFLLDSGKVLAVGGLDTADNYLSEAEVWNPATKTWSSAKPMAHAREWFAGDALADGRILVAGGYDGGALSSVEIYDPKTDTWSPLPSLSVPRSGATATRLPSGKVLVAGGDDGLDGARSTTEIYDPATNKWSAGPLLAEARSQHQAIPLGDGHVLLAGGLLKHAVETSTVEVFVESSTPADAGVDASPMAPDTGAKPQVGGGFSGCTSDAQCSTGHCVDGICCDSPCTEACHSCTLPWAPGKCTLEPYGTDRKNACGAAGSCVGTCDGKGGCMSAGAGTQCAPTRCTSPSGGRGAAFCADKGASCDVSAGESFDCTPYACVSAFGACASICSDSDECAPGFVCDGASRTCVTPAPTDDGGGCATSSSRGSGALAITTILLALVGWRARPRR